MSKGNRQTKSPILSVLCWDCHGTYFCVEIHRLVLKTCLGYCSAGFHPCTRWDPVAVPNAHCCHKIEVRLLLLAVSYLHHPNIWGVNPAGATICHVSRPAPLTHYQSHSGQWGQCARDIISSARACVLPLLPRMVMMANGAPYTVCCGTCCTSCTGCATVY